MSGTQNHKLTPKQERMLSEHKQRQHTLTQSIHQSIYNIDSIESLYKGLGFHDAMKAKALLILGLRSWLTAVSNFDPVTGHALYTGIVDFMGTVAQTNEPIAFENEIKDRVYRIAAHTVDAIQAILEQPQDKILREHAMLPLHAAREVDSISVQWLSRQPGRTLREKLSGKPYIKAVRRRSSIDTAENRLFKAFLLRFEQILIERQSVLNTASEEICEELLVLLQRWLRCEDAAEIGHWDNLPPNNTLLQDKRYRKVWDAWLWLQGLDENIAADNKRLHHDILCVIYWKTLSLLHQMGRFRTVQQPISIDYDSFMIAPSLPVKGYFSSLTGQIKSLNYEKKFGFLTTDSGIDLFFHKNNLSIKLEIDSLKVGDVVSFEIGSNHQGNCADNIYFTPRHEAVGLSLLPDRFDIHLGKKKLSVQITSDYNIMIHNSEGIKNKLQLNLSVLKEIPEAILSMLTDVTFDRFAITDNQCDLVQTDVSVIDLCSIRPRFTNSAGSQVLLPFRLLQQHWPLNVNGRMMVDCAKSKAIAFHSDIESVSMRSLFSHNSILSDAVKSNASMFFIKKLRDYIPVNRLFYLVPDWGNDFDLEYIRKSVNFYFEESTPLPKSIAAIFAWQSSKRFEQDKVRENDFVLVVDAFDGGISITPVQAIYQKKINEILPKSKGISWERHPVFIARNKNIHTGMVRNLSQDGCQISEELIELFGFDGLVSDAGALSFVNDDNWYHLPNPIREILNQNLHENVLSSQTISNCLDSTNRDYRKIKVFILPLENTIKKSEAEGYCHWLGSACSPIKGCQTLNEWQKEAADIALWRDHLPELSIRIVRNSRYENFYLVKDATVTPQRGRTVYIPVKESFTLLAGQPHYSFPLQQGEGNQKMQFVAYLKSPAFPLKEDTACKLQMTYTYGADDPYELKFIPLDTDCTEFKSIRVEWRSIVESETVDPANLPVPIFPACNSWSDFQGFLQKDGTSFPDLLNWCSSKLEGLNELVCFDYEQELNEFLNGRKFGYIKWGAKDRSEKYYCRVNVDGKSVFCHSSQFVEPANENNLHEGSLVYLDVSINGKGYSGTNISFSESLPSKLREKYREIVSDKLFNKSRFIEKGIFSLRFPVLTIWNSGHSLSELDVPDQFRNALFNGVNSALSIIESEGAPDSLKEELFFFLSCLHKDAPSIVGNWLVEEVKNKKNLQKYYRHIAFAIGDAELPWQKELLAYAINPIDNKGLTRSITMEILSIALWRSKELISKLTENELEILTYNLYDCLDFDLQKVMQEGRGYHVATLCKHLELLLSLIRTRASENEKIKMMLAPGKELTKRYVTLIDDVLNMVMDSDIELRSRISLQIEKPKNFCDAPDLLYALIMYLTGDSGANTVVITGVTDDHGIR